METGFSKYEITVVVGYCISVRLVFAYCFVLFFGLCCHGYVYFIVFGDSYWRTYWEPPLAGGMSTLQLLMHTVKSP